MCCSSHDPLRKYIGKVIQKIANQLFETIRAAASNLNLDTCELRYDSKAAKIFLNKECDFKSEDVLWKELLVFFMNTKANTGMLDFIRSIEPLDFDPALVPDYLQCFQSEVAKMSVMGELEEHYLNLENKQERLEMINVIGDSTVCFDDPEEEEYTESE